MNSTDTKKTPVADVLGGDRDEGLENPTPKKEQENMTMVPNAAASTRLDFNGLGVDVDVIDGYVEITTGIPGRTTLGIALTPPEARELASALLDGIAPNIDSSDIEEIEGVSPAEWCRRRRAEKQGAQA